MIEKGTQCVCLKCIIIRLFIGYYVYLCCNFAIFAEVSRDFGIFGLRRF